MKKVIYLFAFLMLFVGCNSDDNLRDELNENRQLWESKQIVDYQWKERLSCFCGGPLERDVYVLNLQKDKVEFDETGYDPEFLEEVRARVFENAHTVEDAFNLVEELLNGSADSFEVEYDATYGYPKLISIDNHEDAIDDEIAYSYSNFLQTNN